jgi:hypothetical protein
VSKLQGRFVFVHSSLLLSRSPYAPPLSLKHQINRIVFFLVLSCLLLSPPLSISSTPSAPHCCGEWVAGDEKLSAVPVGGGGTTTKARNQEGRQRYSLLTNIGWSQCTIAHSQRHPRTTARTKGKKKRRITKTLRRVQKLVFLVMVCSGGGFDCVRWKVLVAFCAVNFVSSHGG